jgi:uncharacterized membrane protein (UPF0127 family)
MDTNSSDWFTEMQALVDSAAILRTADVIDITFEGEHTREVYVLINAHQREKGLAEVSCLDPDLDGILYYFPDSSYIPINLPRITEAVDLAWYDESGLLLKKVAYSEGSEYCHSPFSYLLEAPSGSIPDSNLKVKNARA